jgi:hypothetical protein
MLGSVMDTTTLHNMNDQLTAILNLGQLAFVIVIAVLIWKAFRSSSY